MMVGGIVPANAAAATGSISGIITAPAGTDLTQINLTALGQSPFTVKGAAVAANGKYMFTGLTAGSYTIFASGPSLVQRYYGGDGSGPQAVIIKVAAGQAVGGKNIAMVKEATISGKITVPAGVDLALTTVRVFLADSEGTELQPGQINDDGTFKVTGLRPGTYKVQFDARESGGLDQWYKNSTSFASATTITLKAGQGVTGVDASMAKGGSISGKITAPAGLNLEYVRVAVHSANKIDYLGSTYAGPDGSYKIVGLAKGSYKLNFQVDSFYTGITSQWYKGASSFENATPVALGAGEAKPGINATLVKGAILNGKVTAAGVPGAYSVELFDSMGQKVWRTYSDTKGNYSVAGLATGTYKVAFNRASGPSLTEAQFYEKKGESQGLGAAKAISVTGGKTVSNISANLTAGGSITGTLLDTAGRPLGATNVVAYTKDDVLTARKATTDKAGKFTVTGLTTGSYMLVANPEGAKTATMPGSLYSGNVMVRANAKSLATTVGKASSAGTLTYQVTAAPKALTAPVPKVSGLVVSGQKLTAAAGTWGPAPVVLKYQWKRNGAAISGATANTYVLATADVGKKVTVSVTGSKAGYVTATKTSVATNAVAAKK